MSTHIQRRVARMRKGNQGTSRIQYSDKYLEMLEQQPNNRNRRARAKRRMQVACGDGMLWGKLGRLDQ